MTLVSVNNLSSFGFGNRALYYYNLRQEACKLGCEFFSIPWDGHSLFAGDLLGAPPPDKDYKVFDFCLGEKFYSYNELSTRDVFKLRSIPKIEDKTCAIHFRGTDFHAWNPESILNDQYYYDSIDLVRDEAHNFALFTDDPGLESYQKIKNYLSNENIKFSTGENTSDRKKYMNDFSFMTECDSIISSPSTFCIVAGFVGRQKKIIHSKKWVESRASHQDKFWRDLLAGGNKNYKLWKII